MTPDAAVQAPSAEETLDPQQLLQASRAYAEARDGIAYWQVASTLALHALMLGALAGLGDHPARWLLVLPMAALLVRLFVLQHDCGHLSLFRAPRLNDFWGTVLSVVSGVAYHAWRTEHNWHHQNQGKLSHRGVDTMNSPMTREEALADPDAARDRARAISAPAIFVLGIISLLVKRKRHQGFFPFRKAFRWRVVEPEKLIKSVRLTNALHLGYHAGLVALLGWQTWLSVLVPAVLVGAGFKSLFFFVQHNFEHSYHAEDGEWSYVEVALKGTSYLKLDPVLNWFSASIGLHHVHHLNAHIPNYRLEEARRGLPALAAVRPITWAGLATPFTHVFWDAARRRMVTLAEIQPPGQAA